ncbi:nuclear envelope integral membrane protein 2 isoform X1 [Vombatus ursinus]|uniref:nuclear envelope integral membrane protein 2 isoform X1 n=1 Tax=Vombatus ursinus TaxID=29139 RepID=UPI000FFDADAC|nr:nuclear envelope integral membrane protein 2 isoform X1 [Vombatus ursinus]
MHAVCSPGPQRAQRCSLWDHLQSSQSLGPRHTVGALLGPLRGQRHQTSLESREAVQIPARGVPCKVLEEMDVIKSSQSVCYCYNQLAQMEWKYIWSTIQVKITSSDMLSIVFPIEEHNCQHPETILAFIKCTIHIFGKPKESNDITININPYKKSMCFYVKSAKKIFAYTLRVNRNIVDAKLFLVFVIGIFLFFKAKTLSRSTVFYYSAGTVLGILMTLVFFLLFMRRYIPKYSTFGALMVGCWFASFYLVCQLMEEIKWLWYENKTYILGYILTMGSISFAACYRHGPLVKERSINVLMWTLRLLSLVMVYFGVTTAQVAYAVMVLLISSQGLHYPFRAFFCMGRKVKEYYQSKRLVIKHITEEEYREQGEIETAKALQRLREFCHSADFPSWLTVSRLQSPKRFAEFVLGASHLSAEEVRAHEEQYGLGGWFLEEQLFSPGSSQEPRPQDDYLQEQEVVEMQGVYQREEEPL